ncbi:MAG: tetratricopeptide repeat protein [Deltaproteobacteria bacterium]|nr:tetratricopeptide repeat protein [Deltaproteobacteria bacterium]
MKMLKGFKYRLASILILAAVTFAVYYGSLGNGFVYDDAEQVLRNKWITDIRYLPAIFTSHTFAFAEGSYQAISYRPLFMAFYMLEYSLFGLNAWGWHLVNIILHAVNAVLVFLVLSRLLGREREGFAAYLPALAGALIFAALPVNSEVVSWIGCVPELLYTSLALSAFYLYIGAEGSQGILSRLLPALLFFLAVFTKETAVLLPVFLFAYDSAKGTKPFLSMGRLIRYLPFVIAGAVYICLKMGLLGHVAAPEKLHTNLKGTDYLINAFPLFTGYLKALLLPINDYPLQLFRPAASFAGVDVLVSVSIISALAIIIFLARKKLDPLFFLGLAFIVIPLLPALYAPAISRTPFADRYLYFPSIGLGLITALSFRKILSARGALIPALVLLIFATAVYSVWARQRSFFWKDDRTLWARALEGSSSNYLALHSIGYMDLKEGRTDAAVTGLREALRLNNGSYYPDPTMLLLTRKVLAAAYHRNGFLKEAASEYSEVLRVEPEDAVAGFNLGTIYEGQGHTNDAMELYSKAILFAKNPALSREIRIRLGDNYSRMGQKAEAAANYEEALRLSPGDPSLINRLKVVGGGN